ncbi:AAWKG family protein [Streptomyces sp. NPDC090080]|uniref:AAWKG family protein n=1 Tax=Streptomyces sp. NPDC090080 TaxID=3365939 RepID=UPI00382D88DB
MAVGNWEEIINQMTGWTLPKRDDILGIKGDGGVPWLNVELHQKKKLDLNVDYYLGENDAWMQFFIREPNTVEGVQKWQINFKFAPELSVAKDYWERSGYSLYNLLNSGTSDGLSSDYGGNPAPGQGVNLVSFALAAAAFDGAGDFFKDRTNVLKTWMKSLGDDKASWKGTSASAFWHVLDQLHEKYTNYSSLLNPPGFSPKYTSKYVQNFSAKTLHGDDLIGAENDLHEAYTQLYSSYFNFYWQKAQPLETQQAAQVSTMQIAADPRDILRQMMQDLVMFLFEYNWKCVVWTDSAATHGPPGYPYLFGSGTRTGTDSQWWHNERFSHSPSFGELRNSSTWAAIGQEAQRRWRLNVETNLDAPARPVVEDIRQKMIRVLNPSWNLRFAFNDIQLPDVGGIIDKEVAEAKEKQQEDNLKKQQDEMKNLFDNINKKGGGNGNLNDTLDNIGKGFDGVNQNLNDIGKGFDQTVHGLDNIGDHLTDMGTNVKGGLDSLLNGGGPKDNNLTATPTSIGGNLGGDNGTLPSSLDGGPDGTDPTAVPTSIGGSLGGDTSTLTTSPTSTGGTTNSPGDVGTVAGVNVPSLLSSGLGGSTDTAGGVKTEVPDGGGSPISTFPDGAVQGLSSTGLPTRTNADGTKTTRNPDGSLSTQYPDGSVTTVHPDGTVDTTSPQGLTSTSHLSTGGQVQNPDGSTTSVGPDGSVSTHMPDGTTLTSNPDGSTTTTAADGTTTTQLADGTTLTLSPNGQQHITYPSGTTSATNQDGSVTTHFPDGSSTTVTQDGGVTTTGADGHQTTSHLPSDGTITNPDGSTTGVDTHGAITTHMPDGTTVTSNPDGSVTTAGTDGGHTTHFPNGTVESVDSTGHVKITSPDGSVTDRNPDGSLTTQFSNGGSTTVGPDGSVTATNPNGGVTTSHLDAGHVIANPDGSTTSVGNDHSITTTMPDGSTYTVHPDGSVTTTGTAADTSGAPGDSSVQNRPSTLTSDPVGISTHGTDGTVTTHYPTGTVAHTTPDGYTTTKFPDGSSTVTGPNGEFQALPRPETAAATTGADGQAAAAAAGDSAAAATTAATALGAGADPNLMGLMSPLMMMMGMARAGGQGGQSGSQERVREVYEDADTDGAYVQASPYPELRMTPPEAEEEEIYEAEESDPEDLLERPATETQRGGRGIPGYPQGSDGRSTWQPTEDTWGTGEGGVPASLGR